LSSRLIPKPDLMVRRLRLFREPNDDFIEMVFPNGDSYQMTLSEVRIYFRTLRSDSLIVDRWLDYLWNVYGVSIDLVKETCEPIKNPVTVSSFTEVPPELKWIMQDDPTFDIY